MRTLLFFFVAWWTSTGAWACDAPTPAVELSDELGEASQAFLNGDAAVLEGWGTFVFPGLEDPEVSKIGDNWAIASYPEGGTGNFVQHNGIIFNGTQNPQAAFDFLAYVTGEEAAKQTLIEVDPA